MISLETTKSSEGSLRRVVESSRSFVYVLLSLDLLTIGLSIKYFIANKSSLVTLTILLEFIQFIILVIILIKFKRSKDSILVGEPSISEDEQKDIIDDQDYVFSPTSVFLQKAESNSEYKIETKAIEVEKGLENFSVVEHTQEETNFYTGNAEKVVKAPKVSLNGNIDSGLGSVQANLSGNVSNSRVNEATVKGSAPRIEQG